MAVNPWFAASSQNAAENAANRRSRVRAQKRRKNSPATRNPIVITPDRNSNIASLRALLGFPDEAEQQHSYGGYRGELTKGNQIDVRQND